jgi:hypothetical protein
VVRVGIYVAGWVLWPLVFRSLAARMLGISVSRVRGVSAGLGGVAIGGFVSRAFPPSNGGFQNFMAYLLSAVLGTLACLAVLDFGARPTTLGQLERSVAGTLPQEAGGILIKLGQVLSTRNDLLAPAVTAQLTGLQDHVDPIGSDGVRSVIEAELGKRPGELFARFNETPLAAASIGQVHRARLHDGAEVVIKVQRPDVDELVRRDLEIIGEFAGQLETATTVVELLL